MPFLLLFAFVPAILVIALAVMLISGAVLFLTNRQNLTTENFCRAGAKDIFESCKKKVKQASKPKTVQTIEIIVLKEK